MHARWIGSACLALAALLAGAGSPAEQLAIDAPSERSASADWVRFGVVRYHIEVHERRPASATAGSTGAAVSRGVEGEVLASVELCSDETLSDCEQGQTWAGILGSALSNGPAVEADPLLEQVSFRGWLRDVETDEPCEFFVTWRAGGAPILIPDYTLDPAAVAGRARLSRGATAVVDASCWQTGSEDPAFGAGTGWVDAAISAGVSVG